MSTVSICWMSSSFVLLSILNMRWMRGSLQSGPRFSSSYCFLSFRPASERPSSYRVQMDDTDSAHWQKQHKFQTCSTKNILEKYQQINVHKPQWTCWPVLFCTGDLWELESFWDKFLLPPVRGSASAGTLLKLPGHTGLQQLNQEMQQIQNTNWRFTKIFIWKYTVKTLPHL